MKNMKRKKKTQHDLMAEEFLQLIGATVTIRWKGCSPMPDWGDDHREHNHYDVMVERGGKQYGYEFHDSVYATKCCIFPSAYDVLACTEKYDVGTIDDFVSDFGYEVHRWSDVRKIERIYAAVKDEAANMQRLFGDVMDEFAEVFS